MFGQYEKWVNMLQRLFCSLMRKVFWCGGRLDSFVEVNMRKLKNNIKT